MSYLSSRRNKLPVEPKSPPAPEPGVAPPVPDGDSVVPEILFEHSGWGLYTLYDRPNWVLDRGPEGNVLTHIGCDCELNNWHMAVYIWDDYKVDGSTHFKCEECAEIMPSDAYWFFCKAYNLVNMP